MDKIKVAIVGCGNIGKRHAEHINDLAQLVAVCDIVESKAQLLANQYNVPYYTEIQLLLNDKTIVFDLLAVCTPNGLHAIHTIEALNYGYHVLCEKPLALSSKDCNDMIRAAEKNNRRLFTIKQNRFNPPVVEVKKIIDQGVLGKIYSVQLSCFWNRNIDYYRNSWKGTKELDGGTLFTQFSHFIDILYWMIGEIKEIKAFGKNFHHKNVIEFEDTGVAIIEFINGAIGTINYTVNSYDKNMEGSITIFAEKGTVKIGGQYLNELEYQNIENYEITNLPKGNKPNNYGTYTGSMSNHNLVYKNVIDVLQNGASLSVNAFDGLKSVEIIENIYRQFSDQQPN